MAEMVPPLVAPPPIRAARPPSVMQALSQVQRGPEETPAAQLQQVGRLLLGVIQAHPEMRPKLTQALQLITEAATEGLGGPGVGGPPRPPSAIPPGGMPGPPGGPPGQQPEGVNLPG